MRTKSIAILFAPLFVIGGFQGCKDGSTAADVPAPEVVLEERVAPPGQAQHEVKEDFLFGHGSRYALASELASNDGVFNYVGRLGYNPTARREDDIKFYLQFESAFKNGSALDSEFHLNWYPPGPIDESLRGFRPFQVNVSWGPTAGAALPEGYAWWAFGVDKLTISGDREDVFGERFVLQAPNGETDLALQPMYDGEDARFRIARYGQREWMQLTAGSGGSFGVINSYTWDTVAGTVEQQRPLVFRKSADSGNSYARVAALDFISASLTMESGGDKRSDPAFRALNDLNSEVKLSISGSEFVGGGAPERAQLVSNASGGLEIRSVNGAVSIASGHVGGPSAEFRPDGSILFPEFRNGVLATDADGRLMVSELPTAQAGRTKQSLTVLEAGDAVGVEGRCTVSGTDSAFRVEVLTGNDPKPGTVFTVRPGRPWADRPHVVFSPASRDAALARGLYGESSAEGYRLESAEALKPRTTYRWEFMVLE